MGWWWEEAGDGFSWRHQSLWPHSSSPDVDIGARNKLGDLLCSDHPILDIGGHGWRGLHGAKWRDTALSLGGLIFGNVGASLNLFLHLSNILIDWIVLHRPNLFWMMSTCQILMWRNCVIYEEFRRLRLMMAALVMAVNTRIPSLHINIDEPEKWRRMMHALTSSVMIIYLHYHTHGQKKTQQGEDDAHQDEEVIHLGQELSCHDHRVLMVSAGHVTDILYYHPVLCCNVVML